MPSSKLPDPLPTFEINSMQELEFEVPVVNTRGEIVERQKHVARKFTEQLNDGVHLDMVEIPTGMFLMGSRPGFGYEDEHPQHNVRVASFFMGRVSVTQEQWQAVMGNSLPYRTRGAKRPVDRVSWNSARKFCEKLSQGTGRDYHLPGEAEWEYACRALTTTPFHFGETITTDLANYVGEYSFGLEPKGVYRHGTSEVGSFPPNAFGLFDMHGNVWEWCADAWHDNYTGAPTDSTIWESQVASERVLRGGCWHDPPDLCRSAARLKQAPTEAEDFFGFRVALSSLQQQSNGLSSSEDLVTNSPGQIARRIRSWFIR